MERLVRLWREGRRRHRLRRGPALTSPRIITAELRALSRLAAPIAAGQAGFALMGLVDTAVVGRLGAGPLGAVGLANGLFFALATVGIGVMMGLDPLIAQALGAKDEHRARELLWQGLWLGIAVGAVLAIPVALAPALLEPAGVDPAVAADAKGFLLMRLIGLVPTLWFIGVRSYLQAVGVVRPLVTATIIANVANLFFDVLLVYGGAGLPHWAGPLRHVPALGATGAGLATTLCMVVQLAIIGWPAVRLGLKAGPASWRLRVQDLKKASAVGIPVGLQMGAETGVFALAGVLAGKFSKESLAAHQVALSLASFTFSAAIGVGNAGTVRVGRAVGARDTPAARRSGLVAFAAGAAFMSLAAACFWLLPGPLVRALTNRPEVIAIAVPLLGIAAVFQISDGIQGVGAGVLRGAGDTRFAFLANVVGHYGVGLPLALLFGFGLHQGIFGIWWGLCAGLTAVAAALFWRFLVRSSRPIAPLEGLPPVVPVELGLGPVAAPPLAAHGDT